MSAELPLSSRNLLFRANKERWVGGTETTWKRNHAPHCDHRPEHLCACACKGCHRPRTVCPLSCDIDCMLALAPAHSRCTGRICGVRIWCHLSQDLPAGCPGGGCTLRGIERPAQSPVWEQRPEPGFLTPVNIWQMFIEHLLCARGRAMPRTDPVPALTELALSWQGWAMTSKQVTNIQCNG